ncbi:phage head closure protein [Serratia fonticola]|uniref:Phage head closure protein n=1 Tax=Serratia fonticola TaxID=47917 RepID=A0AAW3WTR8_SERFO|nr:phage head closure protein [Serratia fonticola]MBC3213862.1 phage head closure protein [Serratia fonticola]NYA13135.1 phage head closure protein [Serratia fonticola]NYA33462.1 phage head closure protein [Serratia fonticola]
MEPGRFRHRIMIQNFETVDLPSGGEKAVWVDASIKPIPAEVKAISGRELMASGAEHSEATVRVWLRFRDDVSSSSRMLFRGLVYDIVAALPDARLTRLELLCKSGVKP